MSLLKNSPPKQFLLLGLLPALLFQVIGATLYFNVWADHPLGKLIYLFTKIFLVLWPLFWWKSLQTPLRIQSKKPLRDLAYGLGLGLLLSSSLVLIFLLLPDKVLLTDEIQAKANIYLSLSLPLYILFSLFLCLVHSLLEEYYWRWFAVKGLNQYFSTPFSSLIGNLAFAAHHFIILNAFVNPTWALFGTFGVFIGGACWSHLYQRTGSLLASWVSHICVDASIMSIGYFLLF